MYTVIYMVGNVDVYKQSRIFIDVKLLQTFGKKFGFDSVMLNKAKHKFQVRL